MVLLQFQPSFLVHPTVYNSNIEQASSINSSMYLRLLGSFTVHKGQIKQIYGSHEINRNTILNPTQTICSLQQLYLFTTRQIMFSTQSKHEHIQLTFLFEKVLFCYKYEHCNMACNSSFPISKFMVMATGTGSMMCELNCDMDFTELTFNSLNITKCGLFTEQTQTSYPVLIYLKIWGCVHYRVKRSCNMSRSLLFAWGALPPPGKQVFSM